MKRFDKKRTSHGVTRDHKDQQQRFEQQGQLLQRDKYRSFNATPITLRWNEQTTYATSTIYCTAWYIGSDKLRSNTVLTPMLTPTDRKEQHDNTSDRSKVSAYDFCNG